MIISDSKKFVFFHVPKTGGMSLTYNLARFSRNIDICPDLQNIVDILDLYYPNIEKLDTINYKNIESEIDKWFETTKLRDLAALHIQKDPSKLSWMGCFHENNNLHSKSNNSHISSNYFYFYLNKR